MFGLGKGLLPEISDQDQTQDYEVLPQAMYKGKSAIQNFQVTRRIHL